MGESDTILRFHRSERWVHWSIAIPFMVCYATAVILFAFYYSNPDRPYRDLFSWTHRLSGLCLFAFPTLVLVRNLQDFRIHLDNVRQAWVWTLSDIKWLFLMGLAALYRDRCPDLDAGSRVAWVLHVAMAVAATPLMLGHIFMATINPDTRVGLSGMISGFVDRKWAKHHYRRWYREQFERGSEPKAQPPAVLVHCPGCRQEHAVVSWESLLQSVFSAEPISCSHCRGTLDVLSVAGEPHDVEWILEELDAAARRVIEQSGEPAVSLSLVAPPDARIGNFKPHSLIPTYCVNENSRVER